MGRQIKPLIFLLLVLSGVIFILVNADSTPPEERYYEHLKQQVELYPRDPRSMYDQYQIGMYELQQGKLESARKEFQKVIDDYPYLEYQYGWIPDDARLRIKEIDSELKRQEKVQDRNWPVPVKTATIP